MNFPTLTYPNTIKQTGGAFRIPSPKRKLTDPAQLHQIQTPKASALNIPAASILYFNYFNQFLVS
jgi:hypothetical protein